MTVVIDERDNSLLMQRVFRCSRDATKVAAAIREGKETMIGLCLPEQNNYATAITLFVE